MTLERVQQDYALPNGAVGTIYRTPPRRGKRSRVHCVIMRADMSLVDEPEGGWATWEEAEMWMRQQAQEGGAA